MISGSFKNKDGHKTEEIRIGPTESRDIPKKIWRALDGHLSPLFEVRSKVRTIRTLAALLLYCCKPCYAVKKKIIQRLVSGKGQNVKEENNTAYSNKFQKNKITVWKSFR